MKMGVDGELAGGRDWGIGVYGGKGRDEGMTDAGREDKAR